MLSETKDCKKYKDSLNFALAPLTLGRKDEKKFKSIPFSEPPRMPEPDPIIIPNLKEQKSIVKMKESKRDYNDDNDDNNDNDTNGVTGDNDNGDDDTNNNGDNNSGDNGKNANNNNKNNDNKIKNKNNDNGNEYNDNNNKSNNNDWIDELVNTIPVYGLMMISSELA